MLFLLACAGSPDDTHPHDSAVDTGSPVCGEPGETYAAGMSHAGQHYSFTLVEASPAPPDKGENTWTLQTNAPGVTELVVTPFMPEHGHGSTPATFSAAADGTGTAIVGPMDLFMAGYWELTVSATDGDGLADEAVFAFCLEG